MKPALMTTTGYVYSKDKKYLRTFASYDDNEESFSDRNVFPIGCIKELKKIEIYKNMKSDINKAEKENKWADP